MDPEQHRTDTLLLFRCPHCGSELRSRRHRPGGSVTCGKCKQRFVVPTDAKTFEELANEQRELTALASRIEITTTETFVRPGCRITRTLVVVSARRVAGIGMLQDVAIAARDIVGGRSATAETAMAQIESELLQELKEKAFALGAHAIIGLRLQFGEISGGGKSQLFYAAAQGTPVVLESDEPDMALGHLDT